MSTPGVTETAARAGSVAIFGPGLIGGSIAMALREINGSKNDGPDKVKIVIWSRREEELAKIASLGLADHVTTDPVGAVKDADLVVLCTPVGSMENIARSMAPGLSPTTVITDAGSVKACVVERLGPILGENFVGAHPMAGSERSGLGAARGDLFAGAPCLITPSPESSAEAVARVKSFWEMVGCSVSMMSPVDHDRTVARLSHLPHALAFALINLVVDTLPEGSLRLAGGSFRDATRVAASHPELWTGILNENNTEIASALREMSKLLKAMASALGEDNSDSILDFLKRAKHHRDSLPLPGTPENEEAV